MHKVMLQNWWEFLLSEICYFIKAEVFHGNVANSTGKAFGNTCLSQVVKKIENPDSSSCQVSVKIISSEPGRAETWSWVSTILSHSVIHVLWKHPSDFVSVLIRNILKSRKLPWNATINWYNTCLSPPSTGITQPSEMLRARRIAEKVLSTKHYRRAQQGS